ncbi:MAG: hypothetical protein QF442_01305 [Candidatus Peribacteraceae bacterium]|nr:hypothetical protein [Candidatus Peribacteraceae bacterium]
MKENPTPASANSPKGDGLLTKLHGLRHFALGAMAGTLAWVAPENVDAR